MSDELQLINCQITFEKGVVSIQLNNGDVLILDEVSGIELSKFLNSKYAQHFGSKMKVEK